MTPYDILLHNTAYYDTAYYDMPHYDIAYYDVYHIANQDTRYH